MPTTTARPTCRHPGCGNMAQDGKRGLCWTCHQDTAIRALYPTGNPAVAGATGPRTISCIWCDGSRRARQAGEDGWTRRIVPAGAYKFVEWMCPVCCHLGWPVYAVVGPLPRTVGYDIPRAYRVGIGGIR